MSKVKPGNEMYEEYKHGNCLLDILEHDLNNRLGEYDGLMRKAIKQIGLNIGHVEILGLAKDIAEFASKSIVILEAKKICAEYEVELEDEDV